MVEHGRLRVRLQNFFENRNEHLGRKRVDRRERVQVPAHSLKDDVQSTLRRNHL